MVTIPLGGKDSLVVYGILRTLEEMSDTEG